VEEIRKRRIKKKKFTEDESRLISFYQKKIIKAEETISKCEDILYELQHEWQEYIYNNFVYTPRERHLFGRRDCRNVHRGAVQLIDFLYLIKVKIIMIYWAYKLGLKYKELHGVWLALDVMIKRKNEVKIS